jgi:hypothetical protein
MKKLAKLIQKCTALNPEERPKMSIVLKDLNEIMSIWQGRRNKFLQTHFATHDRVKFFDMHGEDWNKQGCTAQLITLLDTPGFATGAIHPEYAARLKKYFGDVTSEEFRVKYPDLHLDLVLAASQMLFTAEESMFKDWCEAYKASTPALVDGERATRSITGHGAEWEKMRVYRDRVITTRTFCDLTRVTPGEVTEEESFLKGETGMFAKTNLEDKYQIGIFAGQIRTESNFEELDCGNEALWKEKNRYTFYSCNPLSLCVRFYLLAHQVHSTNCNFTSYVSPLHVGSKLPHSSSMESEESYR